MTGAHKDYIMMLFDTIGFRIVSELSRKVDPLGIAAFILFITFLIETVGLEPSSYPHFQWLVWGIAGLFLRKRWDERTLTNEAPAVQKYARNSDTPRILHKI